MDVIRIPFSGFRVFPANQFFERHAAFIMVLNNGSGFGDGGDGVFFHDDHGAVRDGGFHRVTVDAQQVFPFSSSRYSRMSCGMVSPSARLPAAMLPMIRPWASKGGAVNVSTGVNCWLGASAFLFDAPWL